jgi:hypothetical protein
VQVKDQIAYLGVTTPPPTPLAGFHDGRVFMVDISDPEEPLELGVLPNDGGWAPMKIELDADLIYVAYERQGLVIYKNSNPAEPTITGLYNPSEPVIGVSISAEQIYLYNKSAFILRYSIGANSNHIYLPLISAND